MRAVAGALLVGIGFAGGWLVLDELFGPNDVGYFALGWACGWGWLTATLVHLWPVATERSEEGNER